MQSIEDIRKQQADKWWGSFLQQQAEISPEPRHFELLQFLRGGEEASILDVGCGPGHFLILCRRHGFKNLAGFDESETAAQAVRRQGITCTVGDIANPDDIDLERRFGFVVLADVLEHIFAPQRALRNVRRILSDGGHLLVSVPNAGWLPAGLFNTFCPKLSGLSPAFGSWTHCNQFTLYSLQVLLNSSGFTIAAVGGIKHDFSTYFSKNSLKARLGNLLLRVLFGTTNLFAKQWPAVFSPHLVVKARRDDIGRSDDDYWDR